MTNIQTLPSKSQPTESGRAGMGNFFQAPGAPVAGNLSNPDFDSFLSNPESKTQAEELREEQEAAKKRKKPVDAALAQGSVQQQDAPLLEGINPDRLDKKTLPNPSETLEKSNNSTTASPEEAINSTETRTSQETDDFSTQDQLLVSEKQQFDAENITESESEIRGTETAPPDDEMIAMATLDGTEPPTQALREPAITSINRLAAYATLDRNAVTPLTNSGGSSDSGLGNSATGLPAPVQSIRPQLANASTQAAGLFKSLAPELDKFKQTGSSQVQLDLPVGEEESVRIKLSIRGGEIRSTFITESPELREALQKAWPEFSLITRDRGYRLGDPSFQQSFHENNANLGQNNRRQSDGRPMEAAEVFAPANIRKPASARPNSAKSPSTALWA